MLLNLSMVNGIFQWLLSSRDTILDGQYVPRLISYDAGPRTLNTETLVPLA